MFLALVADRGTLKYRCPKRGLQAGLRGAGAVPARRRLEAADYGRVVHVD